MAYNEKTLLAQASDPNLVITPMLNDYLLKHGNDPVDPEIMKRVSDELTKPGRDRSSNFSASAAGTCLRRQEFGYLGKPQSAVFPNLQHTFTTGTWIGMQWAAWMLQAKLVEDIEVPLPWPKYRSMGSADGRGYVWWDTVNPAYKGREFIWENKTVGAHVWEKYTTASKPKPEHMAQIHRYMLVSGLDLAVVTYVDKGNVGKNGWHEFVVEADPELLEQSRLELEELNKAVDNKELHPIKPACRIGTGSEYLYCPFGGKNGVCKTTTRWG